MKTSFKLNRGSFRVKKRPEEFAMTPMIDVIFLLLVFFLATSSFRVVEKLMPSGVTELQSALGGQDRPLPEISPEMLEQVTVRLVSHLEATQVFLNGTPLASFDQLRSKFREIAAVRANVPVVIDPAPEIQSGQVVSAYDWARAAGLPRVYLATRAK